MTDSTLARDLLAYLDSEANRVGDAFREAHVRRIIAEHKAREDTEPSIVTVLGSLVAQVERIADQGAEADVHVTIEQVHEAWDAIGQRAEHHLAVDLVEKLGIVVDA